MTLNASSKRIVGSLTEWTTHTETAWVTLDVASAICIASERTSTGPRHGIAPLSIGVEDRAR